ncbi:MAG: hypothetical protein ABW223_01745 [Rariglobus sp.]
MTTSRSPGFPRQGTLSGFMPVIPTPEEAPWKAGLRSARANLIPGLVLQAFALALLLGFYFHAPTRAAFAQLADLRIKTGFVFDLISTGLCGGLIPLLYLKSLPSTRARYTWTQGGFLAVFWSYKGLEIALWYSFMAWSFGTSNDIATIATKSVIDQFVYCPIWAIPTTATAYFWCENHFSSRAVIDDFRQPRWYARRVLPVLCANLGVWLPLVFIIYALPTPLQLPLQNLALCFFTLMLAHLSQRRAPVLVTRE